MMLILIIALLVLPLGGGGFYWRSRGAESAVSVGTLFSNQLPMTARWIHDHYVC